MAWGRPLNLPETSLPFNCAVCKFERGVQILTIDSYPGYLAPLPADIAVSVTCSSLRLAACSQCGHLQQYCVDPQLQQLIYEVYYNHYLVDSAEAMAEHYRKPFSDFLANLFREGSIRRGHLLEIGCSAGERVPLFLGLSTSYTGIDPSDRIRVAQQRFPSSEFVQGYFPDALPDRFYDTVVSQFNLEHILDPGTFLKSVRMHLNEGGVLLLQVPDVGYFLDSSQPNFLAHEHVQYFRKPTLDLLLRSCGFASIAWGSNGPSLICAARSESTLDQLELNLDFDPLETARKQANLFHRRPELPSGPLVLYGVGPLTYWLLQNAQAADRVSVVDDNLRYHGQGLPGTRLKIEAATSELFSKIPTIVLSLNKVYHSRVLEKLEGMKLPLKVYTVDQGEWRILNLPQEAAQ